MDRLDPLSSFGYLLNYCISERKENRNDVENFAFMLLGFLASAITLFLLSRFGVAL